MRSPFHKAAALVASLALALAASESAGAVKSESIGAFDEVRIVTLRLDRGPYILDARLLGLRVVVLQKKASR